MSKQLDSTKAVDVPPEVQRALASLELLFDAAAVTRAVDQMAIRMTVALQQRNPVFVTVLHGGLMLAGMLQRRLIFPGQFGYVHVGRYGDAASGGELRWHGQDLPDLKNRTVVLIDDIADEGRTLAELRQWVSEQGARDVQAAVLVKREVVSRPPPQVEFAALTTAPGFLVGCGMDYAGYGRNLPAIYVLPGF